MSDSAFDPENFQTVMLIQMMRTYDVLMAFLSVMDAEKAEILAGLHEKGLTFCPNPSLSIEEDASNSIN